MNWLQKSAASLIQDIIRSGWSEAQLKRDGLILWQDGNKFIFSIGDWAKVDPDDIQAVIERTHPDAEVEWDYELGGPGPGNWNRLF